jgi:chromosome partitioning protein
MAKIVVFNQKGGVGKTTTTLNLAALLARRGRPPLIFDLDPQAHLSAINGAAASDGLPITRRCSMNGKPPVF